MKPHALIAVLIIATPAAAVAQKTPAQTAASSAKPAAPPSGPAPSFRVPGPEDEVKAEGALTSTIAAFESGQPNVGDMDEAIVEVVKSRSGALTATLTQLGALKSLEYKGYSPNGVWHYRGEFVHGQADLSIAFSNAGKIAGLWCNPAKA